MTFRNRLGNIAAILWALATLATAHAAAAQDDSVAVSDDSAVWSVIERAWRAERDGDSRWVDNLLSADFVGWSYDSPAPRDRSSTRLWTAFNARQSELLEYELYPLSIIVHGNTAVAHYLFASAVERKGQPVESISGRFTDVLVRSEDGWRFLAWHGGARPAR